MRTSNKISDKKSTDPIDKLIFEKGLRISYLIVDKKLNTIISVLNNGKAIQLRLSDFTKLKNATATQLSKWKLIGGGVGVEWEALNEDLSIKGMIKSSAIKDALQNLLGDKKSAVI